MITTFFPICIFTESVCLQYLQFYSRYTETLDYYQYTTVYGQIARIYQNYTPIIAPPGKTGIFYCNE